jgi:hypothetical protein
MTALQPPANGVPAIDELLAVRLGLDRRALRRPEFTLARVLDPLAMIEHGLERKLEPSGHR